MLIARYVHLVARTGHCTRHNDDCPLTGEVQAEVPTGLAGHVARTRNGCREGDTRSSMGKADRQLDRVDSDEIGDGDGVSTVTMPK